MYRASFLPAAGVLSNVSPGHQECTALDLNVYKHVDPNEEKVYADLVIGVSMYYKA
jgi:hypothetical protein